MSLSTLGIKMLSEHFQAWCKGGRCCQTTFWGLCRGVRVGSRWSGSELDHWRQRRIRRLLGDYCWPVNAWAWKASRVVHLVGFSSFITPLSLTTLWYEERGHAFTQINVGWARCPSSFGWTPFHAWYHQSILSFQPRFSTKFISCQSCTTFQ